MSVPGASHQNSTPLDLAECATLATLLEASAPKPGNVHPHAGFADLSYMDFVISAVATGPIIAAAAERGLGQTVLAAVQATRERVGTNTNLGTLLLVVPLAMVPRGEPLDQGIQHVLASLTPGDATHVYAAILNAQAGGLGEVPEHDVAGTPPEDLCAAMQLAADHDLVARQYTNGFAEVLGEVAPALVGHEAEQPLGEAIVQVQLQLMAKYGDSLVLRKCGEETNAELRRRATIALESAPEKLKNSRQALDDWLRADGHRRNPGTTADLIAAGLFCVLRDRQIRWPLAW